MANDAPDLAPVRTALVAHAKCRHPFSPKRPLLREQVTGFKWVTMLVAQDEIGRSAGILYRGLEVLGLIGEATGNTRRSSITVDAIVHLRALFRDTLTGSEACAYLGVRRQQLSRWAAAGLLCAVVPPGRTLAGFYKKDDLDRFAIKLLGGAEVVESIQPGQALLETAALGKGLVNNHVVEALLDGTMKARGRLRDFSGGYGIRGVLVSESDVRALAIYKSQGLTVEQAAGILRISRLKLRRLGHHLGMTWEKLRVPFSDVAEISRQFVSAKAIQVAYPAAGCCRDIHSNLIRSGIARSFGEEGQPLVYDRKQAERIFGPLPPVTLSMLRTLFGAEQINGCRNIL